jgi:hypothetical protein
VFSTAYQPLLTAADIKAVPARGHVRTVNPRGHIRIVPARPHVRSVT